MMNEKLKVLDELEEIRQCSADGKISRHDVVLLLTSTVNQYTRLIGEDVLMKCIRTFWNAIIVKPMEYSEDYLCRCISAEFAEAFGIKDRALWTNELKNHPESRYATRLADGTFKL